MHHFLNVSTLALMQKCLEGLWTLCIQGLMSVLLSTYCLTLQVNPVQSVGALRSNDLLNTEVGDSCLGACYHWGALQQLKQTNKGKRHNQRVTTSNNFMLLFPARFSQCSLRELGVFQYFLNINHMQVMYCTLLAD